ncbi:hypothetical protein F5141DRAFT_1204613 [Pisolithus sp. B1]|nr:hypothetical protein F5141DRAFT_1204613 [Pisolithus sp. B1]
MIMLRCGYASWSVHADNIKARPSSLQGFLALGLPSRTDLFELAFELKTQLYKPLLTLKIQKYIPRSVNSKDFVKKAAQEAADKVQAAEATRREAEGRLRNGVQPVILPTAEEVEIAKARVYYQEGALSQPDWLYFNNRALFVFDCIIVLFDNRLTQTDIDILANCRRFQIPTYIVRSKADVLVRNILEDMESDADEGDGAQQQSLYVQAREEFITATRVTVQRTLQDANLPGQKVYKKITLFPAGICVL